MQLAEEGKDKFPLASKGLVSDLYIDDIVSSIPNLHEAKQLQSELIACMQSGGFELRKWSAIHPSLLGNILSGHRQQHFSFSMPKKISFIKILGLKWNPGCDSFSYTVESLDHPCTKRTILSSVARVFDSLGILAPLTFFTKHLIQHLWSMGLDWDQVPPIDVLEKWEKYRAELPLISNLSITGPLCEETFLKCELHGFADSSEKGYAAVIYFRYLSKNGIKVTFVCAKSKIAPLKRLSLSRLELCAAVLLARLTSFILNTYSSKLHFSKGIAWSDSTTVLDCIK
ncbi:uncharacterized protein [Leptinotarsa decemlineata]|uniref:uncharacterized protein n=1 Tax=Leptinotarsa decemlineata TaxID=7539 RepID=UPI003D30738F